MKEKQIEALEEMITSLQSELEYIKNGSVVYETNEELIKYVSENFVADLEEALS